MLIPPAPGNTLQQSISNNVANGSIWTTPVTIQEYIKATVLVPNIGSELVPVAVVDPTNVSTNEANLINGNETDLVYNNSSTGTVNKELPGIDIGAGSDPGIVRLWWWTNASYMANDYNIQGSNDLTNWTDLASGLSSIGLEGQSVDIPVSGGPWRYLRVFCVSGLNASFVVISEMTSFESATGFQERLISQFANYLVGVDNNGFITIENSGGSDVDVTVYYL